jgi:hypothetical protein
MRSTWLIAWMAVAALVAAGCGKDKGGDGTGSGAGGSGTTANPAVPKVDLPAGGDRMLAAMPVDAEIILGIDVAKLRNSPALAAVFAEAVNERTTSMGFDMNAECGIDPTKEIGLVVAAVKMINKNMGEISAAMAGLDKAKVLACIEKTRAKIEAQGTLEVDGDYIHFNRKTTHISVLFGPDNMMVAKVSKTPPDRAALQAMAAAQPGTGVTASKDFMGTLGTTNTKATIWGLANGQSPEMDSLPIKFQVFVGSIDVTDGVNAKGVIKVKSPDEAQKVAQVFGSQLASIKSMGMADVAEMKPDGSDVVVTYTMTAKQVQTAIGLAKTMMSVRQPGPPTGPTPPPNPAPPKPATP